MWIHKKVMVFQSTFLKLNGQQMQVGSKVSLKLLWHRHKHYDVTPSLVYLPMAVFELHVLNQSNAERKSTMSQLL